jgi:hypothetical protein
VEIPFLTGELIGYVPRQVHCKLNYAQQQTLRRVYDALHARSARLKNNQHVDKMTHVVPWLLEQVQDGLDKLLAGEASPL